jgi:hypothetical protein
MNKYGAIAQEHWKSHLPQQYLAMTDHDSFFSTLGDQIEERVEELSEVIAGEDPPNETYLEKVGRLNEARSSAERQALQEFLPEPATSAN